MRRKKKGAPVTRRLTKGKEGVVKSCSLFSSLSFFFSYVEVFRYRRAEENNIRNSNKEIHRNTHTQKKKKESTCTTEKHCFFFIYSQALFFFFVCVCTLLFICSVRVLFFFFIVSSFCLGQALYPFFCFLSACS